MRKKSHDETEISVNLTSNHTLVVTDDNGTRKMALTNDKYTLGREEDNTVKLHSDFVSRYHAILLKVNHPDRSSTYRIVDGNSEGKPSKNGIVLNAVTKVSSRELKNGDIITFAPEVHILYLAPKLL